MTPPNTDEPLPIEVVAAGIAHEVRNPLNALRINTRILEEELAALLPDRGAHAYAVLGRIDAELARLDRFVTEFLRFARPPRLALEAVGVRGLLADLGVFVAPACAVRGVELELALGRGPDLLRVDSFQLKQAVLNLVLNALQASAAGARVTLELRHAGDALEITVQDRGEGMAPEVRDRIFEVFFTTREGGTGLGLPIARRIVEAHGGTLTVTSAPGAGTRAQIRLPAGVRR